DRLRTASGNRALRRAVMLGLTSRTWRAVCGSLAVVVSVIRCFRSLAPGAQSQESQLLVDEAALRNDRHVEMPPAKLPHELAGVAVRGEQHQSAAGRREMLGQTRGEALCDIDRSPGAVRIVPGDAADEGRIEHNY